MLESKKQIIRLFEGMTLEELNATNIRLNAQIKNLNIRSSILQLEIKRKQYRRDHG